MIEIKDNKCPLCSKEVYKDEREIYPNVNIVFYICNSCLIEFYTQKQYKKLNKYGRIKTERKIKQCKYYTTPRKKRQKQIEVVIPKKVYKQDTSYLSCEYFNPKSENCTRSEIRCMKLSRIIDPLCKYKGRTDLNQTNLKTQQHKQKGFVLNYKPDTEIIDCSDKIVDVHLYGGELIFSDDTVVVDKILIVVDILHKNKTYKILVAYNEKNRQYYLDLTQFEYHKKQCHILKINLLICYECSDPVSAFDDFNPYSKLSLYGYKVGRTSNLTDEKR